VLSHVLIGSEIRLALPLAIENAGEGYLPSRSGASAKNGRASGKGPDGVPDELTDRDGSKCFETRTTNVVIQLRLQIFTSRAQKAPVTLGS
jgi:hypothetical protein